MYIPILLNISVLLDVQANLPEISPFFFCQIETKDTKVRSLRQTPFTKDILIKIRTRTVNSSKLTTVLVRFLMNESL